MSGAYFIEKSQLVYYCNIKEKRKKKATRRTVLSFCNMQAWHLQQDDPCVGKELAFVDAKRNETMKFECPYWMASVINIKVISLES